MQAGGGAPLPDAARFNLVDHVAPAKWRPYLRLARIDRPVGWWLLLLPCWWSVALASIHLQSGFPSLTLLVLFLIGAVAMRGAGSTYNDIIDRDLDAGVERTRNRPLPSGAVTPKQAAVFLVFQALIGGQGNHRAGRRRPHQRVRISQQRDDARGLIGPGRLLVRPC